MKSLIDHLSQYAAYHRDRRNIATHFVGIPMIVLAVAMLLSRPVLAMAGDVAITPALAVVLATAVFYLRLDVRFALFMTAFLLVCLWLGQRIAAAPTAVWLGWGVGLFVIGWVFQFVGHYYEGRKPAFVDDLVGLIVGPLFVAAEAAFAMGLRKEVQSAIEARVGPTLIRPPKAASMADATRQ
ncbi:MAG: DUF962 domain-containing protein [Burkholderiales bacterium]|nr:DUF962 domain-containing protein [Burkholderiales bacterium]